MRRADVQISIKGKDVSMDLVIELKEKSLILQGADIIEAPLRSYLDGTKIPHIRGRTAAINAEQYELLKDSGYNLNDTIGLFGIEDSMESVLRGENGIREYTYNFRNRYSACVCRL